MVMKEVLRCYTDGGLVGINPSTVGGSWAYVLVNAAEERVREASGFVKPGVFGMPVISNNTTEIWGVLKAMYWIASQGLLDRYEVEFYTDSYCTLCRCTYNKPVWRGVPAKMREWARQIILPFKGCAWILLGGHPDPEELESGKRADGSPVSIYNVWCDDECNRVKRPYEKEWKDEHRKLRNGVCVLPNKPTRKKVA